MASKAMCPSMSLRLFTADMWHTWEILVHCVSVQLVSPPGAQVGPTCPCVAPTSHPPAQLGLLSPFNACATVLVGSLYLPG